MDMSEDANKDTKSLSVHETSCHELPIDEEEKKRSVHSDTPHGQISGMKVGSLLKVWAEVSRVNYLSSHPLDLITLGQGIRRSSIGLPSKELSMECFARFQHKRSMEDLFMEQFPVNVTSLLNEDQFWGCFYNFPELYADVYSPVVQIRAIEDVPELVSGILTRDMVTACLTYLKRTPILGDFVYIKLDLSSKHLQNINVLSLYKYLVYLDLSSNFLSELEVLSQLLYLQYLSVAFNRLHTVLEYSTPQWFLTEVHYKFNSVKRIRDLSDFWSITILDLSHNNIKSINGLESLRYLRRLDLSFNHIQRLENLSNLRLLWLDLSYNNISSFEFGPEVGLWTLLHLEYLNLNENNFTSMRLFSGCTRLRELHVRNNRLSMLLELAVYMRQMKRLVILDLRANPICSAPGYKDVIFNTLPILLNLDAQDLDPVEQRTAKMNSTPDVGIFAIRRLLRLLYVEQLTNARVSPYIPPADTTEVPTVVLVGYEGLGKGTLARRLVKECSNHIAMAVQHTTAHYHHPGHYKQVSRGKFDDMLLAGEFLTYTERDGESYGLSREEGFIKDGKVRLACMDLTSALMLQARGRRPYLILCSVMDKQSLIRKQFYRKIYRKEAHEERQSMEKQNERSTLQVMLSGRIIITGILNEILLCLPEDKEKSEFVIESECSLMMDSEARAVMQEYARGVNMLALLAASSNSLEEACKRAQEQSSQLDSSLYSLYKESQGTAEYNSYVNESNGQNSYQEQSNKKSTDIQLQSRKEKPQSLSRPKSVDFSRYTSTTWKGQSISVVPDILKSSKSVTFTSTEALNQIDPTGLLIEPQRTADVEGPIPEEKQAVRSISTRAPWKGHHQRHGSRASLDDLNLWLAFLTETGLMEASEIACQYSDQLEKEFRRYTKVDDPDMIMHEMEYYVKTPMDTVSATIRDDYEGIHLLRPGLFWDTLMMDDPCAAYLKAKTIIQNIVNSQNTLKPMFNIDFANLPGYPTVEKRLESIRQLIAPRRLFY